jgi:hypothetical protein
VIKIFWGVKKLKSGSKNYKKLEKFKKMGLKKSEKNRRFFSSNGSEL